MKLMRDTFTRELMDEILPLGQRCWNESTKAKAESCAFYGERDFDIDPDPDQYMALQKDGRLLLYTLRTEHDGTLVGYLSAYQYLSPHQKKVLCIHVDSMYVDVDFRGYSSVLAESLENDARELGAKIIGWPTHLKGALYDMLVKLGYVGDEIIMEKRLCAL